MNKQPGSKKLVDLPIVVEALDSLLFHRVSLPLCQL